MNYHKCDGLKQHLLLSSQFCRAEFGSVEFSDQCLISEVSWLYSYLETWGKNLVPKSSGGQLNLFPFGCRTEVPVFQLVVAQESFLETRGHLLFPVMFPFHCKASNGNSRLSNPSQASNLFQKIPVSKIKKKKKKKKIPNQIRPEKESQLLCKPQHHPIIFTSPATFRESRLFRTRIKGVGLSHCICVWAYFYVFGLICNLKILV